MINPAEGGDFHLAKTGDFGVAVDNTMTGSGTWFQQTAGENLITFAQQVLEWTQPVPEPVLGLALLALAGVFVWFTLHDRNDPEPMKHGQSASYDSDSAACHHTERPTSRSGQ